MFTSIYLLSVTSFLYEWSVVVSVTITLLFCSSLSVETVYQLKEIFCHLNAGDGFHILEPIADILHNCSLFFITFHAHIHFSTCEQRLQQKHHVHGWYCGHGPNQLENEGHVRLSEVHNGAGSSIYYSYWTASYKTKKHVQCMLEFIQAQIETVCAPYAAVWIVSGTDEGGSLHRQREVV